MPLVCEELRKLAAAKLAAERPDHTRQAWALVHEAYVRLRTTRCTEHKEKRRRLFVSFVVDR